MANRSAISNEEVVAALLINGTIRTAAVAVGLSERAIYDRMATGEFQAVYKSAKADLLRGTVYKINKHISSAIDTVTEVMQDKDNKPAVRLQAAQILLNHAQKFATQLSVNEHDVQTQIYQNKIKNDPLEGMLNF